MTTYKNYRTGEVISEQCYNRLSYEKRSAFSRVYNESVTHYVSNDNDSSDLLMAMATGAILGEMFSSNDDSSSNSNDYGSNDSSSSNDDSFSGFDGGDSGGGGAGGEW
jgi:uncharacterized membrane protein YgcG